MRRWRYVVKRLAFAVVTIYVAITMNFFLFRILPGTSVRQLTRVPHASPALQKSLEKQFGLDQSTWQQYLDYLRQLAHGNLGVSFTDRQPVAGELGHALLHTLPLVATGTVLAIVIGILTGVLSAWWRGSVADWISTNLAIFFYAVPTQWLALVLVIYLAGIFPTHGMSNDFLIQPTRTQHLLDVLLHMAVPSLTMALTIYGSYTLIVRSAMLETLGEDYVLTAQAKGLRPRTVVRRHAFRNAMLPTTTLIAISLGYVVAGAILIETVFSWPGVGYAVFQAVTHRDYPMLQGAFLLLTISVVICNLAADLLYFRLDPRITE